MNLTHAFVFPKYTQQQKLETWNQEPTLVNHLDGSGSDPWAIFCCPPRHLVGSYMAVRHFDTHFGPSIWFGGSANGELAHCTPKPVTSSFLQLDIQESNYQTDFTQCMQKNQEMIIQTTARILPQFLDSRELDVTFGEL